MVFDLKGKSALITGASGGIGLEIVRVLHEHGAKIGLISRSVDSMNKIISDFKGDNIFALTPCDLTDENQVKDLINEACEKLGGIHILVNNAGITKDGLSLRMKKEDFMSVLNINLLAPFLLSKTAILHMMKQKWGRVINISSVVASMGNPGQANYVSSKGGLNALTKSLALEFASKNITVNSISPGFIKTQMTDVLSEAQKENIFNKIPCGRFGDPKDIAYSVLFLASEQANYINGHNLQVNGGMFMG